MGLRAIKAKARSALHLRMRVPASYYESPSAEPRLVYVRVHTKVVQEGDLKGTNLSYAVAESTKEKILFWRTEVANPRLNGLVVISADEGYKIGPAEPADLQTITVEVSRLSKADLQNKTLPGDL